MVAMSSSKYLSAQKFVSFVNASPTPFHAVKNASVRLEKAGFTKLLETEENWDAALKNGGRFYYTRCPGRQSFRGISSDQRLIGTRALCWLSPCLQISSLAQAFRSLVHTPILQTSEYTNAFHDISADLLTVVAC